MIDDAEPADSRSRPIPDSRTGVIIVDHGSRRQASNDMLLQAVQAFSAESQYGIVEPAHMELASPDIATAFQRCVQRGAWRIIVFPYFLSPGRHWNEDIPRLVAAAATDYPQVEWLVTAPFGLHPGMSAIISDRIQHCLQVAGRQTQTTAAAAADNDRQLPDPDCDACRHDQPCELRRGSD